MMHDFEVRRWFCVLSPYVPGMLMVIRKSTLTVQGREAKRRPAPPNVVAMNRCDRSQARSSCDKTVPAWEILTCDTAPMHSHRSQRASLRCRSHLRMLSEACTEHVVHLQWHVHGCLLPAAAEADSPTCGTKHAA